MKKRSFITLSVIMLITLLTSCKSKKLEPIQDLEPQDEIILTETTTITTSSILSETTTKTTTTTTKATTITTELTTTPTQSETSKTKETTTTPKTTTEKATTPTETTQEIEVNNMPEIVFILIFDSPYANGYDEEPAYPYEAGGAFIDNHGNIKEFFFENDFIYPILPEKDPNENPGVYLGKCIIANYDIHIESSRDTGKKVDINELEKYYETLMNVDINSRISLFDDDTESDHIDECKGYANYYGIRKNDDGELEIILLKGRGDWKYDNTDPLTEEISDWLIETIPFAGVHDYNNWHK